MKITSLTPPLAALLVFAGCGSPRIAQRVDPEIERNAAAARTSYANGMVEGAAAFYLKALDRARLADRPEEIAKLSYNLAACRAQAQQYREALELLDEAGYESAAAGNVFPEALLLRAEILRRLGRAGEAADAVAAFAGKLKPDDPIRVQMKVFLAEAACDRGDGNLALQELEGLDRGLLNKAGSLEQARAAQARARALGLEKNYAASAGEYDRAAALYQKSERYLEMAGALQSSADAFSAAGKNAEAAERYFRAARSLGLGGKTEAALAAFGRAEKLAGETGDASLAGALARLKPELARGAASNAAPAKAQPE